MGDKIMKAPDKNINKLIKRKSGWGFVVVSLYDDNDRRFYGHGTTEEKAWKSAMNFMDKNTLKKNFRLIRATPKAMKFLRTWERDWRFRRDMAYIYDYIGIVPFNKMRTVRISRISDKHGNIWDELGNVYAPDDDVVDILGTLLGTWSISLEPIESPG